LLTALCWSRLALNVAIVTTDLQNENAQFSHEHNGFDSDSRPDNATLDPENRKECYQGSHALLINAA
jgi:hypothetical protein